MMKLKVAYKLEPKQVQKTVKNIENSLSDLIKKVMAEETTFQKECKKLETCSQEGFPQKRDEIINALNQYEFYENISEDSRKLLDYDLFHTELKELKGKKFKYDTGTVGGLAGLLGFGTVAAFTILTFPEFYFLSAMASGLSGMASLFLTLEKPDLKNRAPLKHHVSMRTYHKIIQKSKDADDFMVDMPLLKKTYLPLYETLSKN